MVGVSGQPHRRARRQQLKNLAMETPPIQARDLLPSASQVNQPWKPAPPRTSNIVRRIRAGPIGRPYLPVSMVGPLWPPSLPVHDAPAPLDKRGLEGGEETTPTLVCRMLPTPRATHLSGTVSKTGRRGRGEHRASSRCPHEAWRVRRGRPPRHVTPTERKSAETDRRRPRPHWSNTAFLVTAVNSQNEVTRRSWT